MTRNATGRCMCGQVRFTASDVPDTCGACHCEMCRRWTGSALLGVNIPRDRIVWEGAEHIAELQSSSWAKRGWCRECGSGLYFQVTVDGEWSKDLEVPIGLFDDPNGFEFSNEIYVDHKPDSYAYEGSKGRKLLTRADCVAKFAILDNE